MSARLSEIALIIILLAMLGFVRIYYGGVYGIVFVWKGEFTYRDTLVDLSKMLSLPRAELAKDHPALVWQLEDMGLLEEESGGQPQRHKHH